MTKKDVRFFYRTGDARDPPRLVGSDRFGPQDILDASLGFACPFCGEMACVDFHRPEGDWPDSVTLVCDGGGHHRLDENQPRREVNEYPMTIGWERCRRLRCGGPARSEERRGHARRRPLYRR